MMVAPNQVTTVAMWMRTVGRWATTHWWMERSNSTGSVGVEMTRAVRNSRTASAAAPTMRRRSVLSFDLRSCCEVAAIVRFRFQ